MATTKRPRSRHDNRILGRSALQTRAALLEALEETLTDATWRDVSVSGLTYVTGCSTPAFYQYWPSLTDATLELLDTKYREGRPLTTHERLIRDLLEHEETISRG